jgi:hypothetical protein
MGIGEEVRTFDSSFHIMKNKDRVYILIKQYVLLAVYYQLTIILHGCREALTTFPKATLPSWL